MVADELRREADTFIELLDLEAEIARTGSSSYREDEIDSSPPMTDFDPLDD